MAKQITEVYYDFDPWAIANKKKPKTGVKAAKAEIAEFVLEAVLDAVGDGDSPVNGHGAFAQLSPEYSKYKADHSSSVMPNLELSGDMLDALKVVNAGSKLRLRIKGKEAPKADGHNQHTKGSKLPIRRFIPKGREKLDKDIIDGIREIIEEYEE